MFATALQAHERAIRNRGPLRVLGLTVHTNLIAGNIGTKCSSHIQVSEAQCSTDRGCRTMAAASCSTRQQAACCNWWSLARIEPWLTSREQCYDDPRTKSQRYAAATRVYQARRMHNTQGKGETRPAVALHLIFRSGLKLSQHAECFRAGHVCETRTMPMSAPANCLASAGKASNVQGESRVRPAGSGGGLS